MRQVKYRLYDDDNEVFEYIDFSDLDILIETLDQYRDYFSSSYFKDGNLSQFTGLLDNKGVEIYEGDIVRTYKINRTLDGDIGIIKFRQSEFTIACPEFESYHDIRLRKWFNHIEVIGNIYEHSHLLDNKGGSDYIENIQPLCKSCNSKKHNHIYENKELLDDQ